MMKPAVSPGAAPPAAAAPGAGAPIPQPQMGVFIPCIPGLPVGATGLALVPTKIGGVYVPLDAEGAPMMSHLTPQQQTAVKAALGDFLAKASMTGICGLICCFILCPPCAIYFLLLSCCCVGYQMTQFKKKLATQTVPAQAHAPNWQQQQAAAVAPGGQQAPGPPTGYPPDPPMMAPPVAQAPPPVATQV